MSSQSSAEFRPELNLHKPDPSLGADEREHRDLLVETIQDRGEAAGLTDAPDWESQLRDAVKIGLNRPHLRKHSHTVGGKVSDAKKPREWFCNLCHARVTVCTDGMEAGHQYACPERKDDLPIRNVQPLPWLREQCPECGADEGEHRPACDHEGVVCHECGADGFESRKAMKIHHTREHGEPFRHRLCDVCKEWFDPAEDHYDYCSIECASVGRQNREEVDCTICGESFEKQCWEDKECCGEDCAAILIGRRKTKHLPRPCEQCGETFKPKNGDEKFCTPECVYESGRVTQPCDHCGEEFTSPRNKSREYCSILCRNRGEGEKRRKKRPTDECRFCGEEFSKVPSDMGDFCDTACRAGYDAYLRPIPTNAKAVMSDD